MLYKTIVPDAYQLGLNPVEILKISSKGLDKTAAMQKRAAAFTDIIADIKPLDKKAYLHVITTGAYLFYGPQRNCFVAGTKVVTAKGSKNILDIQVGLLIKTGVGTYRPVLATMKRAYSGTLVSVKCSGVPLRVVMTALHPVFASIDNKSYLFIAAISLTLQHKLSLSDNTIIKILLLLTIKNNLLCFVYNLLVALLHTFCVPFVVHNCDAFNLDYLTIKPPLAKTASARTIQLDGGLKKYHDSSYSNGKAKVYQEHQTEQQGALSSGIIKCARYNNNMHRGLLLILVDADKWALRLNKRASGQDIYLSIGCTLDHDVCSICGNIAHTLKLHCDHVNMHKLAVYLDGTRCCMFNDAPTFYDISGVNVPADPIAFVLRKVASGVPVLKAVAASHYMVGTRNPLVLNKAASTLNKLSKMLKALICRVADDPIFLDNDLAVLEFIKAVLNYPADEIISSCNRKAILLSPKMLFKIIGKETDQSDLFNVFADSCPCCGLHLMQDMVLDNLFANLLKDGSFDTVTPADLRLDGILLKFLPLFGVSRPAINGKAIRITIRIGTKPQLLKDPLAVIKAIDLKDLALHNVNKIKFVSNNHMLLSLTLSVLKKASLVNDLFRRTYARYVLSFALKNSEDTCNIALQKIARYK